MPPPINSSIWPKSTLAFSRPAMRSQAARRAGGAPGATRASASVTRSMEKQTEWGNSESNRRNSAIFCGWIEAV